MAKPLVGVAAPKAMAPVNCSEVPRKKRRTLRDAEQELSDCRVALKEAKLKLIVTARENAKMKVLLMKYIDKDDSLLSTSQLSVADSESLSQSQPSVVVSASAASTITSSGTQSTTTAVFSSTTLEEDDSENSSLWTSDFSAEADTHDSLGGDAGSSFLPVSQLSQMSQLSQVSQWSEFSSTSNLDEIINFLEKQDVTENERMATMEAEFQELKAAKTNVRVGVGVILTSPEHPDCVLIGARKGSHGEGKLALPGGHLEMYESWKDCAIREVKEEVDLDLQQGNVRFAYVTNDPMEDEDKHYITIFMQAVVPAGQVPRNMEPHKCEGWHWVTWASLRARDNLFVPLFHITRSDFVPNALSSH